MNLRALRRRAWPILATVVLAVRAEAADDAGTQSVFAYGAGDRGLAMGGAFVATADDASAMIWNPAGLGRVSRAMLQGAQSGDLGLGMSESYAAVVMPSWRWGTAGLAMRHFGVGGIEQRDDRNQLLAGDLRDSELELALGYGRSIGEAWSLGGALKLQQQSLAGYSGSGLGLDFGVTARPAALFGFRAPWAEGLSYGLALRNVVAPSIRLDRESVPDPMLLRTGLGWRTLLSSGRELVAELDLSHAAGVTPRPHAGLELRLHPAAAVRVGMDGGAMTAGAGIDWHGLSFDYAFADNALAPSHRAGVTMRFGPTTGESRLAQLRRDDERVERRLAEAFQQRQNEQIAAVLARARAARDHGDFDGALAALAALETLAPGDSAAASLERSCLTGKARELEGAKDYAAAALVWDRVAGAAPVDTTGSAGAARCRAASDRLARRSNEIRARFGRAMDAFAAGDLAGARDGFRAVLQLEPWDSEAARMLARAEAALARRDAETPDPPARARVAEAAPRPVARTDAPRAAATPPSGPHLSDRELEDLYQRGVAAWRAQRSDDALRYWELVWSSRPDYREVAAYLKREYLLRGIEAFAAGQLDEATTQWERVLRVDPNDDRARGYLSRARTQRARSREILGLNP